MRPLELAVLAVVVGANNAAVAVALGALGQERRRWRIVVVVGLWEFTVPLVGVAVGRGLAEPLAGSGRWIAAALLAVLGAITVATARSDERDEDRLARRVTTWPGLVVLMGGLSLDNLVVGFALGISGGEPLVLAATIAAASVLATLLGLRIGARARRVARTRTEVLAGLLLLVLAGAVGLGWIS